MKKVWDKLCAYCYLPRLRHQPVFIEAVQNGIFSGDYFGYATSMSADGHYKGLRLGTPAAVIYVDAAIVLAKPEIARAQIEPERPELRAPGPEPDTGTGTPAVLGIPVPDQQPTGQPLPRRLFEPLRSIRTEPVVT